MIVHINFMNIIYETIKISSYRTTEHKTIDEKLNYIDSDHEDIIYSLSSTLSCAAKDPSVVGI